jgi:anti-sigma-K factor RskA
MTRNETHDRFEQLAVGYALSALEPGEEQDFAEHVAGCAQCARALVDHRQTLAHLAYDAADDEPPASVLEGIRAGVAASGRAGAFPLPVSLDAARTRRRDRTVRWTTAVLGAAASVILVVALVIVNAGLTSQQNDTQVANQRLSEAVSQLLVSGASRVDLAGAPGTRAVAVVHGSSVSLVLAGVPVNDRGTSVYVLWEQSRSGDVQAVGTFDVASSELAVVSGLTLHGGTLKALMVTHENGRTAPVVTTQQPVLAGTTT